MGKPSTCAFRCFYDSEKDVCGPSHFCEKVGSSPADNLAPFGDQQKCKALGASDHEAADLVIAQKLEDMKREVSHCWLVGNGGVRYPLESLNGE